MTITIRINGDYPRNGGFFHDRSRVVHTNAWLYVRCVDGVNLLCLHVVPSLVSLVSLVSDTPNPIFYALSLALRS